ncbi:MAG TPA: hypothetical protein VHP11_14645, partial [Tepidisphaeraceae bacterium]|nr:hypothetical protein [Tepidisphaeraceae bacterium]
MGRIAKQGLSKHPTKGFRLSIGKKPDGGYRSFWLGQNRALAEYHADVLKGQFSQMKTEGREIWTEADEAVVRRYISKYKLDMLTLRQHHAADLKQVDDQRAALEQKWHNLGMDEEPEPKAQPTEQTEQIKTLSQAIAAYTAHLERKVPNQLSRSNCNRQISSLKCLSEVLPNSTPMASIGKEELEELVAHFTARPKREKTGEKMAVDTIITTLKHARAFFDWMDGDHWEAPRRMDKIFRIRRNILLTPAEQRAEANGKDIFTVDELRTLYTNANEQQRLYMLLALNCAFTQKDLATLAFADVQLRAQPPVIDRIRSKTRATGVRGHWELWPETVKLLTKRITPGAYSLPFTPTMYPALMHTIKPARSKIVLHATALFLSHDRRMT